MGMGFNARVVLAGTGVVVWAAGCAGESEVGDAATTTSGGGSGGSGDFATNGAVDEPDGSAGESSAAGGSTTTGGPAARCDDGLLNGSETDLDCGGQNCPPCADGDRCDTGSDCDSGGCTNMRCQSLDDVSATCDDGVLDESESDIDCGGPCAPCEVGQGCHVAADCVTKRCIEESCEPLRAELEDCGASPESTLAYATDAELSELLIGAWLLCPAYAENLAEREPAGVVGIEFTDDYRYIYLFEDEQGRLVRGTGIDFTGEWYVDSEDQTATTLARPGEPVLVTPSGSAGFSYERPTFTENPSQMRPSGGSWGVFHSARYVPVDLDE